jgi:hypothetical protein
MNLQLCKGSPDPEILHATTRNAKLIQLQQQNQQPMLYCVFAQWRTKPSMTSSVAHGGEPMVPCVRWNAMNNCTLPKVPLSCTKTTPSPTVPPQICLPPNALDILVCVGSSTRNGASRAEKQHCAGATDQQASHLGDAATGASPSPVLVH